ncbi:cytochrome b5 domain-containing protein [Methanolobus halotolerans]|uniref:Cytochrome B5 n=1 Tax=Methanolobus halotolerans TaxID=2052935 RepID=A0A4E0PX43_9EURY|nr:cytochrome b5 domain-containing protein [Methanolobus halotolerans]TGC09158.1 cytochrome B5 [Methanolobus halotolerans]
MKEFTIEELSKYDGKQMDKIYVVHDRKVYDVTDSISWDMGEHYGHEGGLDLTEQMGEAPHEDEIFEGYEVVGTLVD